MLRAARLAWPLFAVLVFTIAVPGPSRAQDAVGDQGLIDTDDEPPTPEVIVQDAGADDLLPQDALPAAVFLRIEYDEGGLSGQNADDRILRLYEFYDARLYQPIWVGPAGPNDKAKVLIRALLDSERDGLAPTDYDIGTISSLLGLATDTALADLEIRLSKALLDYGRDLSAGRVEPSAVDRELHVYPEGPTAAELLTGAINTVNFEGFLERLAPQSPNYMRLRDTLAAYRAMAAQGGWVQVPAGEVLKPGMRQDRVSVLRQRMIEAGFYDATTVVEPGADDLYDDALVAAVTVFQERHGLDPDGVVGPATLKSLNVSIDERVAQMELNMERRRWMEDDLGPEYVFVNLADFELKVVKGAKTVHTARVVIGKPYHRTPVFSAKMTYMVMNPYWHVPPSIAGKELLPKLKRDPGSLSRDGIRVLAGWGENAAEINPYQVNWASYSARNFPFKLRQDPGNGNALGRIKFMFPNEFNVYIHDTPSKSLFARNVRSFSHGCVRVQDPTELAEVLLDGQERWSPRAISSTISEGRRRVVRLDDPIDVHVTYLTAWVNKDGSVHFRDDIYERDARLVEALLRSRRGGA